MSSNTDIKTTIVQKTIKLTSSVHNLKILQNAHTQSTEHRLKQKQTQITDEGQELNKNSSIQNEEKNAQSNVKDTSNRHTLEDKTNIDSKNTNNKKKMKLKKHKKQDLGENISMKSSFSKFHSLENRNLIHVRFSDAGKTQEKFHSSQNEKKVNCCLCSKPVYKMEEIKAETNIYHKNCFRCRQCNVSLKLHNYRSHEGLLYCMVHFKLLFMPKIVPDDEPEQLQKPELIIRENQPDQLPADVVRASDKPNLGLEELQQLNVRSRFQVFENSQQKEYQKERVLDTTIPVKRSASILSKMTKLKALGIATNIKDNYDFEQNSANSDDCKSETDNVFDEDDENAHDIILTRSKNRTARERPIGLGCNMNDIKSKFEKVNLILKEERREERKQEIQNIRSRLFMGKQARIKEMYQQAVAESENAIISSDKKRIIEIGTGAQSIKERFERGEMFGTTHYDSNEEDDNDNNTVNRQGITKVSNASRNETDVFESAISKKSRRMFMELDANVSAENEQLKASSASKILLNSSQNSDLGQKDLSDQSEHLQLSIVKYNEEPEDIKITTSEISEKFKFFETYRPTESEKKVFRITPPREDVVKMLTLPPDSDTSLSSNINIITPDPNLIEVSQTTSRMLNKFREIEEKNNTSLNTDNNEPKPLKCFTPPLDGGKRYYRQVNDSDLDSQEEYDDENFDNDDDNNDYDEDNGDKDEDKVFSHKSMIADDEALKEAQAAARAKQLRAKFERWESSEKNRERTNNCIDIYSSEVSDSTTIESTKTIRERFENMKNERAQKPKGLRHQVNRFV